MGRILIVLNTAEGSRWLLSYVFAIALLGLQAQTIVTGYVIDARTGEPIPATKVLIGPELSLADAEGQFRANVFGPAGTELTIEIDREGFQGFTKSITLTGEPRMEVGELRLVPGGDDQVDIAQELLPTITLNASDFDDAGSGSQGVSGLLSASRDPFLSAAAFNWGAARFRIRGLDAKYTDFFLNGVRFNDLETGRVFWGQWGGLNDVTRNRAVVLGFDPVEFGFGGLGGGQEIDLRARNIRQTTEVGYSVANRAYRHRVMATHSSGLNKDGFAWVISASRRWAESGGYVDGTPYDAYSYFLSLDYVVGESAFNAVILGAPSSRGRSTASVQEVYDLVGSVYYNPNWGFQDGQVRNSRVATYHQPIMMLRHDWTPSETFELSTSLVYQTGRGGSTALDWFEAPDPRPTYYRNLPSFQQDPTLRQAVADRWAEDPIGIGQIPWDEFIEINRNIPEETVNGVTGKRARYLVEERRNDVTRLGFNTRLQASISDRVTLTGGVNYNRQITNYYKTVDDLLGADYTVNIDRFAAFDSSLTSLFVQNNLDRPNEIIREGDRWGYDYDLVTNQGQAWAQLKTQLRRLDFFVGGSIGFSNFYRDSKLRNGRFPDNSQGESERAEFTTYAAKAGATYKINGRNYLLLNGSYQVLPPNSRDGFASPRTRNQLVPTLTTEKAFGIEGGYQLRTPFVNGRLMGYYSTVDDIIENRFLFLDNAIQTPTGGTAGGFVNYITKGIDTEYRGLEIALEVKLNSRWTATGVAALGSYTFTSRPTITTFLDNDATEFESPTVFVENFFVPNGPQTAYSLGLSYNDPDFWFARLTANFWQDQYLDFFPSRRTVEAVSFVPEPSVAQEALDPDSDLFQQIVGQERLDPAWTLDFFGGKSFKINDQFIFFNIGVNNILDRQDIRTGGFEQSRFDFDGKNVDLFPNRYFYGFGRNYFVSLEFRL
ncbi:MAG: TonB-dependent receptor [Bacteroidota bacterium]